MQRQIRRGDESGFDSDRVQDTHSPGRALPQGTPPNSWRASRADSTGVAVDQVNKAAHDFWTGVAAARDPEFRFHDVPLIVEDLLIQARQLSDAGAPTEMVDEILDHVSALREGRG